MLEVTPEKLQKFHKQAPRFTSYPTAVAWKNLPEGSYEEHLHQLGEGDLPLSLYLHIPFCKTMCLYCACSVILNRLPEKESLYTDYLCREITLCAQHLGKRKPVPQLHFGGGTPTQLSEPLLEKIFSTLTTHFDIDFSKEISIEVDPRTVTADAGKKLRFLRSLGFNRISLGVQDTHQKVQEAVRRYQSFAMTKETFLLARELGFDSINIDLIYGLPLQTKETFKKTVEDILTLLPDRIAFFSYAKVPWLKPHQKAIPETALPSLEEKFHIYAATRKQLIEKGYVAIGMDHFALEKDTLTQSYYTKTLQRNFQGYTTELADNLIGLGTSAISALQNGYFQNLKNLSSYYSHLDRHKLPLDRGKILTPEDILRRWVIHTLMCHFSLNKSLFLTKFHISFDDHFKDLKNKLEQLEEDGLIKNTPQTLYVTELGELFVRIVAMAFDAYSSQTSQQFSQSI